MFTQEQKREYQLKRKSFLLKNKFCVVSKELRLGEVPATHVHHIRGRKNHYLDESTFLACSKWGEHWIHSNPELAKTFGFLLT